MSLKTVSTKELAEILSYTPASIRTKMWRIKKGINPATSLPKPINGPTGHPRWFLKDVEKWLNGDIDEPTKPKQINKGGRPRKPLPNLRL